MDPPIPRQHVQGAPLSKHVHYILKDGAIGYELVAQVIDVEDLLVGALRVLTGKLRPVRKRKSPRNLYYLCLSNPLHHNFGTARSTPNKPPFGPSTSISHKSSVAMAVVGKDLTLQDPMINIKQ